MAKLEEGRFHTVPRREKWLRVFCIRKLFEFRSGEICEVVVGALSDLWSCGWPGWVQDSRPFLLEFVRVQIFEVGVDLDWFLCGLYTCTCRSPKVLSTDWFWQNTAGASTQKRKEQNLQMEPQICLKRWAIHRCWKSWFSPTVLRSQQGPGKKFTVPNGSAWRRHISLGASQREIVEGFLVSSVPFCHVSVGCCPSSDLYRFVKLSYESKLTWMGFW